ncbi:transposable element Tcb1 transposase [Trichonephila clavipes]|nr:transposable element Tcb1 transposase [Trichonephila clavipes]
MLNEEDRDVTKFLVSNPSDESQLPSVYRFTRVLFGISSSPFLLSATIKHHLKKYSEKKYLTKPIDQLTSKLPSDHTNQTPAFLVWGLDFAGPLYVNNFGELQKSYIVLFTCGVIRALYLELVSDMSTNSFLLALRRFLARRGNYLRTAHPVKNLEAHPELKVSDVVLIQENTKNKLLWKLGKLVVVLDEAKQLFCGYVTVGCRRVRRTDEIDRIRLSAPLHVMIVSAYTIRRRLQQSGLSARCPLLDLPMTQNHRRLHRQWCDERRMWVAEWNKVVFTDESSICLQHHDGRIRVCRHRGERMLNTPPHWSCISQRYISEMLGPVALLYLQGLVTTIFQHDNARPHVARIVQKFVNHQIELLFGRFALRIFVR